MIPAAFRPAPGIFLLTILIGPDWAYADAPLPQPLTRWIPRKYAPSGFAIVVAGLAMSAAIVVAGLLAARQQLIRSTPVLAVLFALGVLLIVLITAEIFWEQVVNRYRYHRDPRFDPESLPSESQPFSPESRPLTPDSRP